MSKNKTNVTIEQFVCGSKLGRLWPVVFPNRPILSEVCQLLTKMSRCRPTLGPQRPKLVDVWSMLVEVWQNTSNFGRSGQNVGRNLLKSGQILADFVQFGRLGPKSGQKGPSLFPQTNCSILIVVTSGHHRGAHLFNLAILVHADNLLARTRRPSSGKAHGR